MLNLQTLDSLSVFRTEHFCFKRNGTVEINGQPPYIEFANTLDALKTVNGCVQLWIGDLIIKGKELYGEAIYQCFDHLDYSNKTLLNYESAARSLPESLRREGIDWGHYQVVLGVKGLGAKAELLKDAPDFTVDEFRKYVREYKEKHRPPSYQPTEIPADAPEPPDDDEVNGEYGMSNYGSSMQQLLDECAQAFEHILSLTAEPEIVGVCRNYRQKIINLFAEMA